ncbi:MAG: ABC transporter permease subunit, partial [Halomonas sp.]|nr:ABC transporter permease subunit [Halomonas sp.]
MRVLDLDYMLGLIPILLRYLPLTLQMAAAGMAFALVLSCALAVIRVLKIPGLNAATLLFISFFRGTPLLVQLFLFYYGLPQLLAFLTHINKLSLLQLLEMKAHRRLIEASPQLLYNVIDAQ